MPHDISLITTLAAGFSIALVLGFVAERMKVPALVGYLLTGILIGPATPGFVADVKLAAQLSEIGVMLLMFGVGLHFSLKDLLSVGRIAIPGGTCAFDLPAYHAWQQGPAAVRRADLERLRIDPAEVLARAATLRSSKRRQPATAGWRRSTPRSRHQGSGS